MSLLRTLHVLSVLALFGLFAPPAGAAAPKIAVSIPPLHSLVAAVMEGVGTPALLISGGISPHNASLRPSAARKLAEADFVFWVGPELEAFMETTLKRLDRPAMALLHATAMAKGEAPQGQDPTGQDPHFWLDPANAVQIVKIVARQLSQADPEHAAMYQQNRDRTIARLAALDREMARRLTPLAGIPYLVFHDSYAYLENRYGLGPSQAVTLHAEHQAGPQRIVALRKKIAENAFRCLFHEPQFTAPILARLVENSNLRTAQLDPLGSEHTAGPDLYFHMMEANTAALHHCLGTGPAIGPGQDG